MKEWIKELNDLNKQSWLLIQGIMVILLLTTVLWYSYNTYNIQVEVKAKCGWLPNEKVQCVCTKQAWQVFKGEINISNMTISEQWTP